jgi:hypothetical protein
LPRKLDPSIDVGGEDSRLDPDFSKKLHELIERCTASGIRMHVYSTLRGPTRQAELWARSRTEKELLSAVSMMRNAGAPRLAAILENKMYLCSSDRWATNLLPGQSWHQLGQAADCFQIIRDKATWFGSGFVEYATMAVSVGLIPAKLWMSNRDNGHVQLNRFETPLRVSGWLDSWADLEEIMLARYEI